MDPSDYVHAWYGKDGPQNYGQWSNPEFQELVGQIDRELDEAKRKALVPRAEALMEQDPARLPVSWEKVNDGCYNDVKAHNPYHYRGACRHGIGSMAPVALKIIRAAATLYLLSATIRRRYKPRSRP